MKCYHIDLPHDLKRTCKFSSNFFEVLGKAKKFMASHTLLSPQLSALRINEHLLISCKTAPLGLAALSTMLEQQVAHVKNEWPQGGDPVLRMWVISLDVPHTTV